MRGRPNLTLGICLALLGCQEEKDRAAPLGNCPPNDPNCAITPIGGGGGNAAGAGGGSAGDVTNLTGSIIGVTSDDFVTGAAFIETATLEADAPGSGSVTAKYDGNSYTLKDLAAGPEVWVSASPDTGSAFLPTLQPINTEVVVSANLIVVAASVVDEVYGLLTLPEARSDSHAHVVVRFLDASTLTPLSGVVVTHQGETIAYDASGSWSDLTGQTGNAGYAIIVNAQTQTFTSKQKVSFSVGTVQGSVDLAMRAGALTIADVALTP